MAREVTTTGSKKIKTLYKEFNDNFPYLRLWLISKSVHENALLKGLSIPGIDKNKTLSEVREIQGAGKISFSGRKKVETIEKEFMKIFGLYVQIIYTSSEGKLYYTSKSDDKKTLTVLNREKEAAGCEKGM